ncbi:MAG: hypothetical protein COZ37_05255 [bacterium (Candidatus Ratteibacteria) CG_4_10_14_3_um_filter_41_18]|uniref:Cupin type-2 domain-containing protein n=4 Tax=Candidatus Ratteibacteria TaxID=2979319 RepID=A0A2M7E7W3_9BACT|nr:MAG: hypothetical protein COS11_05305 [bacterium (Candidatus Ratteibacteria) CG01_land_8_20_14_3_00_40_19]PIW33682.1 MAG: hypothetical protein COW28_03280 [bacterium (Candidatus Ratteibacteria) CG15_BIG_FIL_POST_REV_8_21_14_020_41_12]PIX76943.1 MAG: hypothetical protein COZ37_05255 [bacterium (Candidatus Ratteibacteria) CG_4_10_14_3_um_filter_41_18]PJA61850.1 MAG: hypothetical protein CO162_04155 [bacterium (Candidatus Ratteibacteria) CG_4_9_14_3_um_filter_41_21]HCG77357.1 hypothetical prote
MWEVKKMAELERRNYQIWGEKRKEALRKCKEIIESWGIRMPEVKPQVLDLGLGDFYKVGLIEYWIANNREEGYCGKFLFVFDGQTCPYHHHNFKHETFFILKGKVKMVVGGREMVKSQGDVLAMEQKADHSFTGIGPALLLEVSKPCQPNDNIFENKKIGENGIL